jgi:hypothetical protein
MRALTVLKETSFNLFGRVLPRAMVHSEPYCAVHLEYLPIINLGRIVPYPRCHLPVLLPVSIDIKETRI